MIKQAFSIEYTKNKSKSRPGPIKTRAFLCYSKH